MRAYTMDFREATDRLCSKTDHNDVAKALGVSLQSVRQARLPDETKARRDPPKGWRNAVIRVAEDRVWHYRKLIQQLREQPEDSGR
jgi:hypothetical protein